MCFSATVTWTQVWYLRVKQEGTPLMGLHSNCRLLTLPANITLGLKWLIDKHSSLLRYGIDERRNVLWCRHPEEQIWFRQIYPNFVLRQVIQVLVLFDILILFKLGSSTHQMATPTTVKSQYVCICLGWSWKPVARLIKSKKKNLLYFVDQYKIVFFFPMSWELS